MKILNFDSTIATVSAGTAAAPSISFANDPNTGIYSPGADQVAISTGGTGRLFIRADGGVAVNTAVSPLDAQMQFAVGGPIGLFPYTQNVVGTSNVTFRSGLGSASAEDFIKHEITNFNNGSNYGTALSFSTRTSTAALERLRITSAGLVGIGTPSPLFPLDVNGVIYTRGRGSTFGVLFDDWRIYNSTAPGALVFDNGSERARIDSSGRLLVGTVTSADVGGASAIAQFTSTAVAPHTLSLVRANTPILAMANSGSVSSGSGLGAILFCGNDGTDLNTLGAQIVAEVDGTPGANDMPGRLVFSTTADGAASPTERMRITSAGVHVLGGGTAESNGTVTLYPNNSNGAGQMVWNRAGTTNTSTALAFRDGGAAAVGSITYTNTATAYNTSSDYRLKENVTAVTDGITRLQQLKPSRFNFIADPGKTVDGFIAHEVQAIVPEAITGEKDAVDDEGNPVYQGIDQSKLVPLLTAALQEAVAKIESLEARLTAAGI